MLEHFLRFLKDFLAHDFRVTRRIRIKKSDESIFKHFILSAGIEDNTGTKFHKIQEITDIAH